MIKIILTVITIIFIGLIVYSYSNKKLESNFTKIESKQTLVDKEVIVPQIKEVKQKNERVEDKFFTEKSDINKSALDDEEAILVFEQSVAEKFSKEGSYTGRVYGVSDYNGEKLPISDSENLENETPPSLGEWENTERTMDNH